MKEKRKARKKTVPEILLYLARKGESNKWEIAEGVKKSYSNIHNMMKKLPSQGLVTLSATRKGKRNPKIDVEYYKLTRSGLLFCIYYHSKIWNFIEDIAKEQGDALPLIFGKWSFFVENGVKDEVIKRLQSATKPPSMEERLRTKYELERLREYEAHIFKTRWKKLRKMYDELFKANEELYMSVHEASKELAETLIDMFDPTDDLTKTVFLGDPRFDTLERQKEFLSVLKKDPDIAQYIELKFDEIEKQLLTYSRNLMGWRTFWYSLEDKDPEKTTVSPTP